MTVEVILFHASFSDGEVTVTLSWDSPGLDELNDPIFTGPIILLTADNTSLTRALVLDSYRGNGQAAFTRTLTPGDHFEFTGGGPVKNVEDIPSYSLRTI